jgi:mono/diheme cytochrome c family protein
VKRIARIAAAGGAAAAAAALACGSARKSPPLAGPTALDERERRGEIAYMRHCHSCHPNGEAGLGPSLNDKPLPGALIKAQVRKGIGAMPSFDDGRIGDAELDDVVAYLGALRRK